MVEILKQNKAMRIIIAIITIIIITGSIFYLTSNTRNEIAISRKLSKHEKQKEENQYYNNLIDLKVDITKWKNETIEILDPNKPYTARSSGNEIRELLSHIKELRNEIQELEGPKIYKGIDKILEEIDDPLEDAANRLKDILERVDGSYNLSNEYLQTMSEIISDKIKDALLYMDLAIDEVDDKKTSN